MITQENNFRQNLQNNENKSVFLSVLIPAYNAEKYISKCLDSIISQTYKNFEIIVCDDGSSDETPNILQKYATKEPCLSFFSHDKNMSSLISRNELIRKAEGEYITFVDADDTIKKGFFTSATKNLNKNKVDILMYQLYKPCLCGRNTFYGIDVFKFFCSAIYDHIPVYSKFYKREFLLKNMPQDFDCSYGEDFLFNLYLFFHANTLTNVNKIFYRYNVGVGRTQKINYNKEDFKEINKQSNFLYKNTSDFLSKNLIPNECSREILKYAFAQYFLFPMVNFNNVDGMTKHELLSDIFSNKTNEEIAKFFNDTKFLTSYTPLREGISIIKFYVKELFKRYARRFGWSKI